MKKKFKQLLSAILTVLMLLSAVPIAGINLAFKASAAELQSSGQLSDTISYTFDEATGTLTISGTGDMPDYNHEDNASPFSFYKNHSIKKVIIKDGVTSIGDEAFSDCYSLNDITIAASVASIGNDAFRKCERLTSVLMTNGVTSIGDYAFFWCERLANITIPDSVTSIGNAVFSDCISLTNIIVDENNPVYDSRDNCNAIIETETNTLIAGCNTTMIPDSVTKIGDYAFYWCGSLANITIPDGVTSIGDSAFDGCNELTSIKIPDGVTSIGDSAFEDCNELTSIKIPDSVTSIGECAFYHCENLSNISIPNGVDNIDFFTFNGCTCLASVVIPASVTHIEAGAFSDCDNLTDVYFNGIRWQWNAIEIGGGNEPLINANIHFNESDNIKVYLNDSVYYIFDEKTGTLTIGGIGDMPDYYVCNSPFLCADEIYSLIVENGVTSIGNGTFECCSNLASVVIPESVTSIGEGVFYSCNNLTSVTIPENVTSIGGGAFGSCTYLTVDENNPVYDSRDNCNAIIETATNKLINGCMNTVIPESVTSIGDMAFYCCTNLKSITIPNGVTVLESNVFDECENLTSITIPDSVISIGCYTFLACSSLTDIYFNGTKKQWDEITIEEGNNLLNVNIHFAEPDDGKIYLNDTVYYTFDEATGTLTISGTGDMPDYAYEESPFYKDESIHNVIIENGITSIGKYSFSDCIGLKSVALPESVTYINYDAFSGCTSLANVDFPDKITYIGSSAFADCTGLTSVDFPDSLTHLGSSAFDGCTGLTEITIPDSLTELYEGTFAGCTSLTSITIPENITRIDLAFVDCTGITDIKVDKNNSVFDSRNDCNAIIETETNKLILGCKKTLIPDSVTCIDDGAFYGCTDMESITIPDGVTSIGDSAFYMCLRLKSITIPDSVTRIAIHAFAYCDSLTDVYYGGTEEQWNEIVIETCNAKLLNANIHFMKCLVTFNPQGGTVNPASVTVERGESIVLPTPTRAGNYAFRGWSEDSSAKKGTMIYKPTKDATLYAIWELNSKVLASDDFYSFDNSENSFHTKQYIKDSDLSKLQNYVDAHYDKDCTEIKAALAAEKNKEWAGSCYGMAATILLDKYGRIAFNENFANGAATMKMVGIPKENENIESAINYYQISQILNFTRNNKVYKKNADGNDWQKGLASLVDMADNPVLFIYTYHEGDKEFGHALIITGITADDDGYSLSTYDSRTPDSDVTVKIAKDFSTCCVITDADIEEEADSIQFENDFTKFDCIDIDGPNNDFVLKPAKELSAKTGTTVKVQGIGNITIRNSKGETLTITNGKVSGTMKIFSENLIVYDDADGNPAPVTFSFEVEDSDSFTFESTEDEMGVSVLSDDIFASAETANADTIVITENEGISLSGDDIEYETYLSLDSDYCNMFKLEGKSDDDIDILYGKNGVKVSGTQVGTTTLTVYGEDNDTDEYKFDTNCKSVLIADDKSGVKIMGSSKDNGVYDTSLLGALKLKLDGLDLKYREKGKVKMTVTNGNADKCSYRYSSSDTKVADVDSEGNIITKGRGRAAITCTVIDEYGRTAENTCTVNVRFTFWQWILWIFLFGFLWY